MTCLADRAGLDLPATGGTALPELVAATYKENPGVGTPKHIQWNTAAPPPGHFITA